MSLTRGDPARRRELFGDGLVLAEGGKFRPPSRGPSDISRCHRHYGQRAGYLNVARRCPGAYAAIGVSAPGEDAENVRFRSTIEFPAFLLHVLKVMSRDDGEHEGQLDDKRLIKRFDEAAAAGDLSDEAEWVRDFGLALLKLRNLFDGFILKRQYTASNGDDGDWSLQRLLRRRSKGRSMTGYINTFSTGSDRDRGGRGRRPRHSRTAAHPVDAASHVHVARGRCTGSPNSSECLTDRIRSRSRVASSSTFSAPTPETRFVRRSSRRRHPDGLQHQPHRVHVCGLPAAGRCTEVRVPVHLPKLDRALLSAAPR